MIAYDESQDFDFGGGRVKKISFGFAAIGLGWCALASVAVAETVALTRATVGAAEFQVELAQTPEQRERGLMYRAELPGHQGMLFVQPPGPAAFWMKNTLIPLDLLFFDGEGRLSQIVAEAPPCKVENCPIYASETPTVRYILEINAGEAARRSIRLGDRLQLEKLSTP
ncbi:MAG: DUF192 domain-containing protein [Candidatus Competibacter sp.]|nr:DUF192 domain-containing protein [Candidatus Competibacter sp.]